MIRSLAGFRFHEGRTLQSAPFPARSRRLIPVFSAAFLTVATLSLVTLSAAPVAFDLPAQPAGRAVLAFSQQAQVEVIFSSDDLRAAQSAPVVGSHEPAAALALLLKPTGFTARRNLRGKFVVIPVLTPSGALRGRILQPGGASAAGIRLNLAGTALTTTTDRRGDFIFPKIPAGTYPSSPPLPAICRCKSPASSLQPIAPSPSTPNRSAPPPTSCNSKPSSSKEAPSDYVPLIAANARTLPASPPAISISPAPSTTSSPTPSTTASRSPAAASSVLANSSPARSSTATRSPALPSRPPVSTPASSPAAPISISAATDPKRPSSSSTAAAFPRSPSAVLRPNSPTLTSFP